MGSTAITEAVKTPTDGRQPWPQHFMDLAEVIAKRSTCQRLKVGCVFVKDNRILTTGFNGALPGRAHCDQVGCTVYEDHCVSSVHAEENGVAVAAQHGVSLQGSTLYVTSLPCLRCFKLVLAAGCMNVQYKESYGSAPMSIYYGLQGMSRLEQLK